jgi:aspartyl-tRNA(Asn)/glutamyl-tRNA(Gln) amidotransferase subunit C
MSLDIHHVAHLARLHLAPDEAVKLGAQLSQVLEYVNHLNQVDVSGVEPTAHAIPVENVFRADEVKPGLNHDDVLANAPARSDNQFLVPKIIE